LPAFIGIENMNVSVIKTEHCAVFLL